MSSFPISPTKDLLDDAVRRTRASPPPPEALNKRAVPRMSIDEINATDWDTLREKYLNTRRDDRGPVERFLDLVDAPRNLIFGALAPGLRRKSEAAGNTGAFGMGRVNFSDVLGDMGVEPGIVRGVLGFVGDVAFDPLTYVGPAGWGAKVATASGKGVRFGVGAGRAFKAAEKAVKQGRPIADEAIAALHAAAGSPRNIREAAFGGIEKSGGLGTRAVRTIGKTLGADTEHAGGLIGRYADEAISTADSHEIQSLKRAVQDVIAKHGTGAGPGIKIGRDASGKLTIKMVRRGDNSVPLATSEIGHIPFTDYTLSVPAFTAPAKQAARVIGIANRIRTNPAIDPATSDRLAGIAADTDYVVSSADEVLRMNDAAREAGESPAATWNRKIVSEELKKRVDNITALRHSDEVASADPLAALALKPILREHEARARVALSRLQEYEQTRDLASALRAQEAERMRRVADAAKDSPYTITPEAEALLKTVDAGGVPALVTRNFERVLLENGVPQKIIDSSTPEQLVAELRSKIGRQPEQVLDDARAWDREHMTKAQRALLEMSDSDIERLNSNIDALQRKYDASMQAAEAVRGSAIAFLDTEQAKALELQKQFLNTESGMVGVQTMTPLQTAAKWVNRNDDGAIVDMARRFATKSRDLFGGDQGAVQRAIRDAQYAATDGAHARGRDLLHGIAQDLHKIATDYGLKHKEDELLTLALAKEYQASGTGHVHFFEADEVTPTRMMKTLESAVHGGLLSNPALNEDLEQFAKKWGRSLVSDITQRETEAGILDISNTREAYVHHAITPKAREYIKRTAENTPDSGVPASVNQKRQAALQSFEKPRTTDSARFKSAITGQMEEVWRGERALQSYTDAEIAGISDMAEREGIMMRRALLDEYDSLPFRPPMKANDPMRINDLLTEGKFQSLLGTRRVPGGFMDETLGTTMFSRLTQSERALATAQMANEVVPAAGIQITAEQLRKHINDPVGTPISLGNGAVGKLVKLADDRVGVRVGDDVFRALASDVRGDKENPMVQAMGDQSLGSLFHENVASKIENAARLYNNSDFWKALDTMTAYWKTVTLMHPSWTIGNMIGDGINMAMNDPKFVLMMARYPKQTMQMLRARRDPEALAKIAFTINGAETNGLDIWNQIKDSSVVNSTLMNEPATARAADKGIFRSRLEPFRQAYTRDAVSEDFKQAMNIESIGSGKSGIREKAKAAYRVASDRVNRGLIEPWYRANTMANDAMRILGYLSYRDQGFSHEAAVNRLVEAAFDYANQTSFERGVAKRLFPFWSWLKNNSIYQARLLVNRPIYAGMFPSLQRAIEESINGDESVPMPMRPKWMREQLSLLVGNDPETRTAVMLGNLLPQEQALLIGRFAGGIAGLQDALKYGASSLNPLIRAPLEIGAGKEFFSDRTIAPTSDGGDISIPQYALNQIRPIRELQKMGQIGREQGIGPAAGRAILGGRLQPASDERLRLSKSREFQTQEDRLRSRIRTAVNKNDAAGSVAARAKLLRLYEQMVQQGYDKEVPAWARKRLASLATLSQGV
jgi:phosphosulfolactate phosphohydrolase-like enzyme